MRIVSHLIAVALSVVLVSTLRAEPDPRAVIEAPKDETPLQMLKRGSKVYDLLDVDAALSLYSAETARDKDIAKVYCVYAVAMTKLEHAVEKKFGRAAADEMLRAAGEKTEADVDEAKIEVEGETAKVTFKGEDDPVLLKRVDGAWKLDTASMFKDLNDEQFADFKAHLKTVAEALPELTRGVVDGDQSTAEWVISAVKKLADPPPPPTPGKGGL